MYDHKGNLIFQGEYKNGQLWKGKAYEYDYNHNNNDILKFEGEYLDGKKNGKGKEYDCFGKQIFEGFYKEGVKWKGKQIFYKDSKKQFEWEYLNGDNNKKGKEYDINDNLIYEGGYYQIFRNGYGKEYDKDVKLIFEGEYNIGSKKNGREYNSKGKVIFNGEYNEFEKPLNGKKYEYT